MLMKSACIKKFTRLSPLSTPLTLTPASKRAMEKELSDSMPARKKYKSEGSLPDSMPTR